MEWLKSSGLEGQKKSILLFGQMQFMKKASVKGCVRNTAVMIIKAIDIKGKPDIIAVEVMENESLSNIYRTF